MAGGSCDEMTPVERPKQAGCLMTWMDEEAWRKMLQKSFEPRQWFDGDGQPQSEAFSINREGCMWVYREMQGRFVVGFFSPDKEWHADKSFETCEDAAERVRWLNGG